MPKHDTKTIYRLDDLEVQEVSLVDKPANQRKFILVKAAQPAEGVSKDVVDDAMAERAQEDTNLLVDLHPEVQKQLGATLEAIGNRCLALGKSVLAAKAVDKAERVVPEQLLGEVAAIHAAVSGLMPAPAKKAEADDEEEDASAEEEEVPAMGGKKKKPPAYKEKADALIAAVEKLDAGSMGAEAMALLAQSAAREAISCASDAMWRKDWGEAMKYARVAYMLIAQHSMTDVAYSEQLAEMAKLIADAELKKSELTKAGKKISSARFSEIDKIIRALLDMAEDAQPGYKTQLFVAKSQPDDHASKTIDALIKLVERKDDEIKSLKGGTAQAPNSVQAGDAAVQKKRVKWPLDMNADYLQNPDLEF